MPAITRDSDLPVIQQCANDPRFEDLFLMVEELEEYLESVSEIHSDPNDPAISLELQLLRDFPAILAAKEFIDRQSQKVPPQDTPHFYHMFEVARLFNVRLRKVQYYWKQYKAQIR